MTKAIWISRDRDGLVAVWSKQPSWMSKVKRWDRLDGLLDVGVDHLDVKILCGFMPEIGKLYKYTPNGKVEEVK